MAYNKAYYEKNRAKCIQIQKEYSDKNRAKIREQARIRYAKRKTLNNTQEVINKINKVKELVKDYVS